MGESSSSFGRGGATVRRRAGVLLGIVTLVATTVVAVGAPVGTATAAGVARNGQTQTSAAASCWSIKQSYPASADGIYWLWTPKLVDPEQFYCDMTTDGGGWVLVGRGREGWTLPLLGPGLAVDGAQHRHRPGRVRARDAPHPDGRRPHERRPHGRARRRHPPPARDEHHRHHVAGSPHERQEPRLLVVGLRRRHSSSARSSSTARRPTSATLHVPDQHHGATSRSPTTPARSRPTRSRRTTSEAGFSFGSGVTNGSEQRDVLPLGVREREQRDPVHPGVHPPPDHRRRHRRPPASPTRPTAASPARRCARCSTARRSRKPGRSPASTSAPRSRT